MIIKIRQELLKKFSKEARKIFPVEFYCYLLGRNVGKNVEIYDIFLPQDEDDCILNENFCVPTPKFWRKVNDYCEEKGWQVVGDLHSHCYDKEDYPDDTNLENDPSPSYQDFIRFDGWKSEGFSIFGICQLVKKKSGRIYTTFTWWKAECPPKIKIVREK